ncbi:MAG: hypothetical protein RR802_06465 [Erysipelotrichaceae bacterium]
MINIKRIIFSMVLILTLSISLVPTAVHAANELKINGVDLLSNQNIEIAAGKGYVKYNTNTRTVELNNATLDNTSSEPLILNGLPFDINVSLKGINRLVVSDEVKTAIYSPKGRLTITGIGENPTLIISSGIVDIGYNGIKSDGLNIENATIHINNNIVAPDNSAISSSDPINITNSNININRFSTGMESISATIKDNSVLKFDECSKNFYIDTGDVNINDSKIYSTNNAAKSSLIFSNGTNINLKNSIIEAKDGTLINGIKTAGSLNVINSAVDIISESPSFGGMEQMSVVNSTINAISKNNNAIRILKLLNIKDSIVNAEGRINKAAILVDADKLGTDYVARITLSDNLYVKNNLKISISPLDAWFFKTSFIADTETELKTDLSNAASIVNIDFKRANYDAVEAAINTVPKDLTIYTTTSVNTLNTALKAVVRELKITEQAKVDKYATDINTAVKNLQLKPVEPTMSEGSNQTIKEGNDGVFKSNAELKDFIKVLVDDNEVDKSNYELKSGSTIVTLKKSYLNTLTEGSHTLEIVSKNGSAKTNFTIVKNKVEAPNTGMNHNNNLFLVLMFISSISMIVIKRKEMQ